MTLKIRHEIPVLPVWCLAALLLLAAAGIAQSPYTQVYTDKPIGYLTWKNPVAQAGIAYLTASSVTSAMLRGSRSVLKDSFSKTRATNVTASATTGVLFPGGIRFGTTMGDPSRTDDDNIEYIGTSGTYLFIDGYGNATDMSIDEANGTFLQVPQVDLNTQSAGYLWKTLQATTGNATLTVEFRMWLVRDVLKWQYIITNKSAQTLNLGFRTAFDVNFAGKASGPYYLPGSQEINVTHLFSDSNVPSEWFIRNTPSGIDPPPSSPLLRFRMPLQGGEVTRPQKILFARVDPDLSTYGWGEILTEALPINANLPPMIKEGLPYGDSFGVGLYYWINGLAYNSSRTIQGQFQLDWSSVNTLGKQFALGLSGAEYLDYQNGNYSPSAYNLTADLYNASRYVSPTGTVSIHPGQGLVLDPPSQPQQAKTITGVVADPQFQWTLKPDGTASGLIPVDVTAYLNPGGSITTRRYVSVPALPSMPAFLLNPQHKYQFVGFPFQFINANAFSALSQVVNTIPGLQIASWDPQTGYQIAQSANDGLFLEPGKGYWLNIPDNASYGGQAIPLTGATPLIQTNSYSVQLKRGWNAISNPFQFSLTWAYCNVFYNNQGYSIPDAIKLGLIRPETWAWDSTEQQYLPPYNPFPRGSLLEELKPSQGYWLFASEGCYLIFMPNPFLPPMGGRTVPAVKPTRTAGRADQWQAGIIVETSKGKDSRNIFGINTADQDGSSVDDIMKPPIGPTGITAYFPHPEWGRAAGNYATDIRAPGSMKSWDFNVQCTQANEKVTMRWPDLSQIPARLPLYLTDQLTGQRVAMRTSPSYTFNSGQGGVRHFTISVDSSASRLMITSTQVQRIRGSSVTISCGLTTAAAVTLRIRNAAGRLVRTLGPVEVSAQGTLNWDGLDDHGRGLPAGMYVGELYAETTDGQRIRTIVTINTRN